MNKMITGSSGLSDRSADRLYLCFLVVYLGALLCFSSFFYLATEDYELVVATRLIGSGVAIGKSTGWPYLPLAPYLLYPFAVLFGENILVFRLITAGLILASIFPIYWVLRSLCAPFLAFSLTLFGFSLTTFPHPRLEYYIEASFLAFSIYFAVKVIRAGQTRDSYFCSVFLLAAFASRGFPNLALLLGLLPVALFAAVMSIEYDNAIAAQPNVWLGTASWNWGGIALFSCCTVFLLAFMKKAVYNTLFYEYGSLVSPANFGPLKQVRSLLGPLLLLVLALIYLGISWRTNCRPLATCNDDDSSHVAASVGVVRILLPFAAFAIMFLFVGLVVFRSADVAFFLFPLDIFLDHTRQLGGGRSYIVPLFLSLLLLLVFLRGRTKVCTRETAVALFLVLLLPSTFARFFPTYNLLFLASFALAGFLGVIMPKLSMNYLKVSDPIVPRVQWAAAIFLLLFAFGSNLTLLVATQVSDLVSARLSRMERGPVRGILIEQDIVSFFSAVNRTLGSLAGPRDEVGFLSNRFLNYIPLIYGWNDVFAGQNLIAGLGKLWSFDDLLNRSGIRSEWPSNADGRIHYWRNIALERIVQNDVKVLVMSLYTRRLLDQPIAPSADPFREFLRRHFVIAAVIAPTMKIHRRSAFPEGAVILRKK